MGRNLDDRGSTNIVERSMWHLHREIQCHDRMIESLEIVIAAGFIHARRASEFIHIVTHPFWLFHFGTVSRAATTPC